MSQGRPRSIRIEGSGSKLYLALKLSGLSWGAKTGREHISQSRRWAECSLPKSANTVIEDIRAGIPLERINSYARYFQVSPELFLDDKVSQLSPDFSCEILKGRFCQKHSNRLDSRFDDFALLSHICGQNQEKELFDLHRMVSGVYLLSMQSSPRGMIRQGVIMIGSPCGCSLSSSSSVVVDGVEVGFEGRLFRWHNFLHMHYHSQDHQVLGYMITPDPMHSVLIRQRKPFHMRFHALAGSLGLSLEPDRTRIVAMRQETAHGGDLAADYRALCDAMRSASPIHPNAPDALGILDLLWSGEA